MYRDIFISERKRERRKRKRERENIKLVIHKSIKINNSIQLLLIAAA